MPVDYSSHDDDNRRWIGFEHRADDIVISTRSKTGTTWLQMICALLVFQTPDLPAPLADLSPWLDRCTAPRDDVWAHLGAQRHRRFIKTHTPLDGLPIDDRVTYIVTGRNPLDMAVSLFHQSANIDRVRLAELTGHESQGIPEGVGVADFVRWWIAQDVTPVESLDSLPGLVHHVSDAWRRDAPNVVMVHYEDLIDDLGGALRTLAARLGIDVAERRWPALIGAATFDEMRGRDDLVPDAHGVFKDRQRFFRRGSSGEGRSLLTADEVAAYEARLRTLAPPEIAAWLDRGL